MLHGYRGRLEMMRSLGLWMVVAGLSAGCSNAMTLETDAAGGGDSGRDAAITPSDAGHDAAVTPSDTGVDAPITANDTGTGSDASSDAGHDAAPRPDGGMCVDLPPDPTR